MQVFNLLYIHKCVCVFALCVLQHAQRPVPFNLLDRLISEMKGGELACLQDMILLSMQRAVQVMALETQLPQSKLKRIAPSIVM